MKKIIKSILLKHQRKKNFKGKYKFINNSKNKDKMCFILIGYKPVLWGKVLKRIEDNIPSDIDVCLTSSGKYISELADLCNSKGWSYLSTKRNNLCLASNITIKCFPNAKFIYKLDEDMFISNSFFETLYNVLNDVKENSIYKPGIIAPLIPINGYGFTRLLDIFNMNDEFQQKFGKIKITCGSDDPNDKKDFTKNIDIPPYFWNKDSVFSNIDKLNEKLNAMNYKYSVCPIRFSIGSILFERNIWEDMGGFTVRGGNGMACDEIELCAYCNTHSLCTIVSENVAVGHLAYGPQTGDMYKYFEDNIELF